MDCLVRETVLPNQRLKLSTCQQRAVAMATRIGRHTMSLLLPIYLYRRTILRLTDAIVAASYGIPRSERCSSRHLYALPGNYLPGN